MREKSTARRRLIFFPISCKIKVQFDELNEGRAKPLSALLLPSEILSMSAQAAQLLVESGDGDCALLYLALLECGGDAGRATQRLRWPEERLSPAWGRLAALGLAQPRPDAQPAPPPKADDRPPEYSRGEIAAALEREPLFQGLCREMENRLGRVFTDHDLRCLYTMYDHLGLGAEVILLLTSWAVGRERRQKNSPAAFPRMPQIQREAFKWKRLGIDTLERAEDYLRRQEAVDGREWAVLQAVGVTERRPAVEKEREFIAAWVDMGISDELIRLAYERTVYQKKAMNWPYMNKILQSWHASGYRTTAQVEAGDRPPKRGRPPQAQPRDFQPSQERIQKNADWLDKFLAEQKKGEG